METRVRILEHEVGQLMVMRDQVAETREKVFEMSVLLEQHVKLPVCPLPGECIGLGERLGLLEIKAAETKGGWKVVAAVSALFSGIAVWLVNHFATVKHP